MSRYLDIAKEKFEKFKDKKMSSFSPLKLRVMKLLSLLLKMGEMSLQMSLPHKSKFTSVLVELFQKWLQEIIFSPSHLASKKP